MMIVSRAIGTTMATAWLSWTTTGTDWAAVELLSPSVMMVLVASPAGAEVNSFSSSEVISIAKV